MNHIDWLSIDAERRRFILAEVAREGAANVTVVCAPWSHRGPLPGDRRDACDFCERPVRVRPYIPSEVVLACLTCARELDMKPR